jgi:hypothetical protein
MISFGMRLSRLRRLAAVLLVGWAPLVANGGQLAHGCGAGAHTDGAAAIGGDWQPAGAMHADHAAQTVHAGHTVHTVHTAHTGETEPSGHDAHTAHAEFTGHAADQSDRPTRPSDHHAADCSCVGACCPSAAAALATPSPYVLPTVCLRTVTPPGRPAHAVVAAWVDFVLPFATAPPVSLGS